MTGAGHWVVGSLQQRRLRPTTTSCPWPTKTTKATVYGVSGFGIYPGSQNPDLAWEYCKELAGPQQAASWRSVAPTQRYEAPRKLPSSSAFRKRRAVLRLDLLCAAGRRANDVQHPRAGVMRMMDACSVGPIQPRHWQRRTKRSRTPSPTSELQSSWPRSRPTHAHRPDAVAGGRRSDASTARRWPDTSSSRRRPLASSVSFSDP